MSGIATIKAAFNCLPVIFGGMGIQASGITFTAINCYCYMPYPSGQGDSIWQGGEFGLSLASASSAAVSVTHRVSDPKAFSAVTARLYVGSIPVGTPAQFRKSASYVTDTVTAYSGINAGNLPFLNVKVFWHQVAPGLAYVQHSSATSPAPAPPVQPGGGMMTAGIV
jgi:hypothetical protein